MPHTHRTKTQSDPYPFFHCVAAAGRCNPRSHGNVTYRETCSCGATRTIASNMGENEAGQWIDTSKVEDDERLPRRLNVTIKDSGMFATLVVDGDELTVEHSGGCPVEKLLAEVDWDREQSLQTIADDILSAWSDGYDGDPSESGLVVTVTHGNEAATANA